MEPMTQAEYARHRGVSRPAITKLISSGKIPASAFTVGPDGKRRIDAAAADFALGESRERIIAGGDDDGAGDDAGDPTFGSNAGTRSGASSGGAKLTAARTATEIYRARTAELEYEQRVGKLLAVEDVTRAMERCAAIIVRELEQLPNFADDLAAALSRDGVPGMRQVLKNMARDVRGRLEQNMRVAPVEDETNSVESIAS